MIEMHFRIINPTLGIYKIGPDPDELGLIRIYSVTDTTAVQFSREDIPDLILALQKLTDAVPPADSKLKAVLSWLRGATDTTPTNDTRDQISNHALSKLAADIENNFG